MTGTRVAGTVLSAALSAWVPVITLTALLAGCVTTDLSDTVETSDAATLVLYPMASSENSTRCMISAIDNVDVRDQQSWRLTSEYLIPAGAHLYSLICEESLGSVPVRGYSFELRLVTREGGRYGLMQRQRRGATSCIEVRDMAENVAAETPLAEFCL